MGAPYWRAQRAPRVYYYHTKPTHYYRHPDEQF